MNIFLRGPAKINIRFFIIVIIILLFSFQLCSIWNNWVKGCNVNVSKTKRGRDEERVSGVVMRMRSNFGKIRRKDRVFGTLKCSFACGTD